MKTLKIINLTLLGFAFGISVYLTMHHYKINILNPETASFCTIGEVIDCDGVATSEYSTFLSIPVSSFGIFAYAFLILLIIYDRKKNEYLAGVYLISLVMLAFSLWEMFASYILLKKVCIFCTLLYIIIITLTCLLKVEQKASFKQIFKNLWKLIKSFFPLTKNKNKIFAIFCLVLVSLVMAVYLDRYFFRRYSMLKAGQEYTSIGQGMQMQESRHISSVYDDLSVSTLNISGSPYKGNINAPVEIVMFGDFECQGCLMLGEKLNKIYQDKQGLVKLVYKFFPLDNACNSSMSGPMHVNACNAAYYAYCAYRQNKFWEMYDLIADASPRLSSQSLDTFASTLKLDMVELKKCIASEGATFVKNDTSYGNNLGINVTPTIFINKKNVTSLINRDSDLLAIIEYLLAK